MNFSCQYTLWQAWLHACVGPYHSPGKVSTAQICLQPKSCLRTQAESGVQSSKPLLCLPLERSSLLQVHWVLSIPLSFASWAALLVPLRRLPHQDRDLGKDWDQGQSQGKKMWPRGALSLPYYQSMNELGGCYVIVNPQTWV